MKDQLVVKRSWYQILLSIFVRIMSAIFPIASFTLFVWWIREDYYYYERTLNDGDYIRHLTPIGMNPVLYKWMAVNCGLGLAVLLAVIVYSIIQKRDIQKILLMINVILWGLIFISFLFFIVVLEPDWFVYYGWHHFVLERLGSSWTLPHIIWEFGSLFICIVFFCYWIKQLKNFKYQILKSPGVLR